MFSVVEAADSELFSFLMRWCGKYLVTQHLIWLMDPFFFSFLFASSEFFPPQIVLLC